MTMTLHDLSDRWQALRDQAAKVVVGQDDAFEQVIVAVVAGTFCWRACPGSARHCWRAPWPG